MGKAIATLLVLCCSVLLNAQNFFPEFGWSIDQAKKENWEKAYPELDSLLLKGSQIAQSWPDSALVIFQQVYLKSEAIGFPDGMASALLWIGGHYVDKNEGRKALSYFRRALSACERSVNRKEELFSSWYNSMAAGFSVEEQYDSAMQYYFKALNNIKPGVENIRTEIILRNNIGNAYCLLLQWEKAIPFLKKAEMLAGQYGYTDQLAATYQTLSKAYISLDKTDTASLYLNKALPYYNAGRQKKWRHYLQGFIFYKDSSYRDAISEFGKSLDANDNDLQNKVSNWIGMGVSYFHLGNYQQSTMYLLRALERFDSSSITLKSLMEIYESLSENYDSLHDYQKAYHYRTLAFNLKDTINSMINVKTLRELEAIHLISKNEQELTKKKMQLLISTGSLRKKNIWIGGIAAGALIIITTVIILYQKQRLKLHRVVHSQQQQKVEVLKAVIEGEEKERGRIGRELHDDIMVQLSIVKMGLEILPMSYPEIEQTEDYQNITQQMNLVGQKIRQTAHNLMPDALLEQGLISAVHYFCKNVEKLTGLKIHVQHYGEIPRLPSDIEISIFRITQELVQNILKHAAAHTALVQLNYRDNFLNITVEDDGVGMRGKEALAINQTGLTSIRNRVKAMNGNIDIHSRKPHGTSVHIELLFDKPHYTA